MITTMAYGVVSFLIALVSSWVGSLIVLRPLAKPPPVFWVERARLIYPARAATASNMVSLPVMAGFVVFELRNSLETRPSGIDIIAMVIGAYLGGMVIALRTEKRVRDATFRTGNWFRGLLFRVLILSPYLCVLFATPLLLPDTLNSRAVEILVPAILVLAFGASGGGYIIARWIGLAQPASPRLAGIVADAATRTGIHPRAVYELKSSVANGLALPVWGQLIITDKALKALRDPELAAVCVHELTHLSESWGVSALRVCRGTLLFLPILLARPVWGDFGHLGITATLWVSLLLFLMTRRVGRRMEVRADAAGRAHQGEEGTYPRSQERQYETNLMPAVMAEKRRAHPHLYDRLIAAGVTPAYPRPAPPSSDPRIFATLVTMAIAVALYWSALTILVGRAPDKTGPTDDSTRGRVPDKLVGESGEPGGIRTLDPRLKRPLLYQLSYRLTALILQGVGIPLSDLKFCTCHPKL
jgi:Zn-dependent protease with chaperone function